MKKILPSLHLRSPPLLSHQLNPLEHVHPLVSPMGPARQIYMATQKAMKAALAQIQCDFQLILTDAMPLKGLKAPVVPIIKGDAQCLNIAAASILAKVTRDRYMEELEKKYPQFKFSVHKGYGTKLHMEELAQNGPIEGVHRKSFRPISAFYQEQLKLF